jgi:hypothetical protein
VEHALRDHHALARAELDRAPLEVDEEPPLHHLEVLVLAVVPVPVELALEDAEPHEAVVHAAERAVPPLDRAAVGEAARLDDLERPELLAHLDVVLGRHGPSSGGASAARRIPLRA